MGLRMQPRNERFFTLFSKAGSNVVESAAILMERRQEQLVRGVRLLVPQDLRPPGRPPARRRPSEVDRAVS
jgi:hypothetical protein